MRKCKLCGGSGILYDTKNIHGSHGELRVCDHIEKQCNCNAVPPYQIFNEKNEHSWCPCRTFRIKLIKTKKAFRESQIPRKFRWKFIDDFDIVSDKAKKIIRKVNTLKNLNLPNNKIFKRGFYFYGPAGSGKTLLACIALQEFMLKYGWGGKFVDLSRQFFQRLRNTYSATDESYGGAGQILDELINVPFLVIDDFGLQRNTQWEMEMLYNLIDSRYAEERPIIITSNISIDKFKNGTREKPKNAGIDIFPNSTREKPKNSSKDNDIDKSLSIAHDRIHSRILEMCEIIPFELDDYRKKSHQDFDLKKMT